MPTEKGSSQRSNKAGRPVERRTMANLVYLRLLDDISSGTLPPGQRIVIDQVARDLEVSITPVREAIMRLQSEGLISDNAYAGLRVVELEAAALRELFEIRGVLEGYAARLALKDLQDRDLEIINHEFHCLEKATEAGDPVEFRLHNPRFHQAILAPAKDHAVHTQIAQLNSQTERFLAVGVAMLDRDYLEAAQADHRRILDLVRLRSADQLEILVRNHALTFADHMARRIAKA
jgi:DNA-binding GntR family transcriptional regulator